MNHIPQPNVLNPNALDSNRGGRLTLPQALGLLPWAALGLLLWALAAAALAWAVRPLLSGEFAQNMGEGIFIMGFALLIAGAMLYFGYLAGGSLLVDILLGQVRQMEGEGTKFHDTLPETGRTLIYAIGKINFEVPSRGAYKKLVNSHHARVYYLPRSKTLVNLEWGRLLDREPES